jgi:hypothetical protein
VISVEVRIGLSTTLTLPSVATTSPRVVDSRPERDSTMIGRSDQTGCFETQAISCRASLSMDSSETMSTPAPAPSESQICAMSAHRSNSISLTSNNLPIAAPSALVVGRTSTRCRNRVASGSVRSSGTVTEILA